MTKQGGNYVTEIDKILEIAQGEIGYLEKSSLSSLNDKTSNAGSGNYTKYWAEVAPSYQGQPWCAAFITWCMMKALGQSRAQQLLKHYPFVYCPELAAKGPLFDKPVRGDIVLFYRKGEYSHTGFVTYAEENLFRTIEGNTSAGSEIIANGGAVCAKEYKISNLPGTKFMRPAYESESGDLTMTQYEELKQLIQSNSNIINAMGTEIAALKGSVKQSIIYNYIDDNMPQWAREAVQWCVNNGIIQGTDTGLNLDERDLRWCVILFRIAKLAGNMKA